MASHDDDEGNNPNQYLGVGTFEPIPHDHDFCERVVINVSETPSSTVTRALPLSLCVCVYTVCKCVSVSTRSCFFLKRSTNLRAVVTSQFKSRTQYMYKQTCWKDEDHMDNNHNSLLRRQRESNKNKIGYWKLHTENKAQNRESNRLPIIFLKSGSVKEPFNRCNALNASLCSNAPFLSSSLDELNKRIYFPIANIIINVLQSE